jgi:anti-sigma factor RsiW
MQCKDAEEGLSALIDGEGAGERQQAAAEHIAGCPQCTALANDYRHVGETLRAVAYVPAPAGLEAKVRARLAVEALAAAQAAAQAASGRWRFDAGRWMQQAAALVVVAGLAALVSWHLTRSAADQDRQQRDVLAAHVRSLLQEAPIQVASSERHLVRPWFNGRVEFAPGVKDLTPQNFTLLGGRVDWIDGRRVATLVYKRRLHIINVFMWPADVQADAAPRAIGLKGYNAISWTSGGMVHWAISGLNAKELAELQALL